METKEVAVKANGAMPAAMGSMHEEVIASDVVLPRICLMQGLSEMVSERKAQIGDIVRSTSEEVLGSDKKPIEFIPITFRNMWKLQETVPGKKRPEFRGLEPRNAGNDHLPWDFKKDGADWQRIKVVEVFALLPQDLDEDYTTKANAADGDIPNLDKTLLPCVITFQSTGFKAGKAVVTHFVRAQENLVEPYLYKLSLGAFEKSNDQGKFMVWDIGAKTSPIISKEEKAANPEKAAYYWSTVKKWADRMLSMVAAGNVAIDDDEAEVVETATTPPPTGRVAGGAQF
jgi:hypothetical protein